MRRTTFMFILLCLVSGAGVGPVAAAGPKFRDGGNKHNLSSLDSNTGVTYKAKPGDPLQRDTQVCIFCHTPHNASPQGALWNRKDTTSVFGIYTSSTLVIRRAGVPASYGEPNGSSRLCLSCHDGITADLNVLGNVYAGGPIDFPTGKGKISGVAAFDAKKISLGHHPVSFVYDTAVVVAIQSGGKSTQGYKLPPPNDPVKLQKLQNKEWMQCTTCHDPHQNQTAETAYPAGSPAAGRKIAPFWVLGTSGNASTDHDTVCLKCHNITKYGNLSTAWPWP
ncbi:cytochrome C [Geobacter luticola]|uniref:Cytochrome C n=2 Tax=Geomobilimonas luticola TaxID=1114878 RepID=A0ABS5SIC3_9BACT|nr:cytochrome C [Geomobilimonas luticola]